MMATPDTPTPTMASFSQVTDAMSAAAEAFQSAGDRLANSHSELAASTRKLVQDHAEQMAEAFGRIAQAKTPLQGATLYANFLMVSAQRNARQLMEIGQMMARMGPKA